MRRFILLALVLPACGPAAEAIDAAVLRDAFTVDAFQQDSGFDIEDGGLHDANVVDAFSPDASSPDAGSLDANVDASLFPCGDLTTDLGEVCDDGNNVSGDGCRADCLGVEVCADGFTDVGEWCPGTAPAITAIPGAVLGAPILADADADGDVDVYLVVDAALVLLENDGAAMFAAPIATGVASAGVLADLDGDDAPDLIVPSPFAVHLNDGTGRFGAGAPHADADGQVSAGDLDGDGDADVVSCDFAGTCIVLTNAGTGVLTLGGAFSYGAEAVQARVIDVDGDGDQDVVLLQDLGTNNVTFLFGNGDATFDDPIVATSGFPRAGAVFGDVDDDGDVDIAHGVMVLPNRIEILRTDARAAVVPTTRLLTTAGAFVVQLVDADLDGHLDLYGAGAGFSTLYEGDPTGSFATTLDSTLPVGSALADLDGDGAIDSLSVASNELRVRLATP